MTKPDINKYKELMKSFRSMNGSKSSAPKKKNSGKVLGDLQQYRKEYKPVEIERKLPKSARILGELAKYRENTPNKSLGEVMYPKKLTEKDKEIIVSEVLQNVQVPQPDIEEIKKHVITILSTELESKIPTLESVVEYIKSLKGNDRIDISNIRNGEQLASLANKKFDMNDQRWHGSSTGLTKVYHDASLSGEGTQSSPLSVAGGVGEVDSVNGLTGDVIIDLQSVTDEGAITTVETTFSSGIITPNIKATTSAGVLLESANGTDIGLFGASNTENVTWYGNHNFSTATQDTIAAFVGVGKTLSSLSTATYPSFTELSYVKGVTSSIQTQLGAKAPIASPTFTGTVTTPALNISGATASTIAIFDGSKNLISATTATYPSLTELSYVKGVTSAIQTQLNAKEAALTFSTGLTRSTNTITNNLSTGVSGGQSVIGGTAAGNNLTLSSTANATKGKIYLGSALSSYYDELNGRLYIGGAISGVNTFKLLLKGDVSNAPNITFENVYNHQWHFGGGTGLDKFYITKTAINDYVVIDYPSDTITLSPNSTSGYVSIPKGKVYISNMVLNGNDLYSSVSFYPLTSDGSDNLSIIFGGGGAGGSNRGAYTVMRGNEFSTLSNQRGNIYFVAGEPGTPGTAEGSINFWTSGSNKQFTFSKDGYFQINNNSYETVPAAAGSKSIFFNSITSSAFGLIQGVLSSGTTYIQSQRVDGTATVYSLSLQPNGGFVGIGTVSPGNILDAVRSHNGQTDILVQNTNAGSSAHSGLRTTTDSGDFFFGSGSNASVFAGGGYAYTQSNVPYTIWTNNAERVRVQGNGYVAIGQTSATALVDIAASSTTRAPLRLRSGTAPTSPNDGDIWFDGTDIKMRISGTTKTFTLI